METGTAVKNENRFSRKAVIIAAAVFAVLIAAAVSAFVFRNAFRFKLAERNALSGNFASASYYADKIDGEYPGAQTLNEYISLRLEINAVYPSLITDFDYEKIRDWRDRTQNALSGSDGLTDRISQDMTHLSDVLNEICGKIDEFESLRPGIIELTDVFDEVNRLYTKDESGENTAFTISEEKAKITRWEALLDSLQEYMDSLPNGEQIYLLNYLVKEARGETRELRATMDKLLESSSVGEYDRIRADGEGGTKKFPSVESSSGISVNLTDEESYVDNMYISICRSLTSTLGEYYKGF